MGTPSNRQNEIKKLVTGIQNPQRGGRKQTVTDSVVLMRKLAECGAMPTLEPLLPLCLSLQGKPYELSDHFPFSPVFKTDMPRTTVLKTGRQVSKSTTLASHGIMLSNVVPYFRTLYVMPLYEQIRRFSNNYVRPFIDRSPVRSLWSGTNTENSVLQRSFKNLSTMIFTFALLDVDRVRGLAADSVNYDETLGVTTPVFTRKNGFLPICKIIPGDEVASYDSYGNLCWRRVVASQSHGFRRCFKITTKDKNYVVGTAEHPMATDSGWRRISQIIDTYSQRENTASEPSPAGNAAKPDAAPTVHGIGHVSGRRVRRGYREKRGVPEQPRLATGRIQLDQVPRIVRVYKHTTREAEERRLRDLLEHVPYPQESTVRLLSRPLLPKRAEAGDASLARSDRSDGLLRRTGLVDRGRRCESPQPNISANFVAHRGILVPGSGTVAAMDDDTWAGFQRDASQKAEDTGRVPAAAAYDTSHVETSGCDHTVRSAAAAVQGGSGGSLEAAALSVLRGALPTTPVSTGQQRELTGAVLRQTGVSNTEPTRNLHAARQPTCRTPESSHAKPSQILREPCREQSKDPGADQSVPQKQSREGSGRPQAGSRKTTGVADADAADVLPLRVKDGSQRDSGQRPVLPGLQTAVTAGVKGEVSGVTQDRPADQDLRAVWDRICSNEQRSEILSAELSHGLHEPGSEEEVCPDDDFSADLSHLWDHFYTDEREAAHMLEAVQQAASVEPVEIESIEYVGWQEVWDIEVEDTHNFFAGTLLSSNCQDLDPDHFPIIREVMSHSDYGLQKFTGTPKTLDNPLEGLWRRSSQAEWFVPCFACGAENIPSAEFHVDAMIGPNHDDISEECPGVICHKCRRPVFPRQGRWVHRYPQRRWDMAGYHVPQIIMPLHYSRPHKWAELRAKRDGWGNTTPAMFYNEVLGESVDAGQKLISETEIRAACLLPWANNSNDPSPTMTSRLHHYPMRLLSVDWGGGGQEGVSFTTIALLGYTTAGQIHCLWGKRLVASQEHLREAKEVLHWLRAFRCQLLAHDYTGAGVVRETVMVQAGFDLSRVMPIQYVRAAANNLMRYIPPTPLHNRAHYRLDKTRSLLYMFQAIKLKLLQFYEYDYINDDDAGLLSDLLALVEEKTASRLAGDIYTITRNPMLTDDFAQAINIGCAALWHANNAWPDFASAAAIGKVTNQQIEAAGSRDFGWEEDRQSAFFGRP